jgi:hypothetical protein
MKHSIRITLVVITLMILGLVPAGQMLAQDEDPGGIVVNYAETEARGNGLGLDVYFTVVDDAGQVVPSAQVRSATVAGSDDTVVSQPTTAYYIVLVLDASGSMSSAMQQMQEAARAAIDSAPAGAHFQVIRFDNEVTPLLEQFYPDGNRAINAVTSIEQSGGGTCLYDAAYQAVELLVAEAPAQRRAVILFTDGRDELTAGQGDTCSQKTYTELVSYASQPNSSVTIHTIGMSGRETRINQGELESMASITGGFSAIGGQDDLITLFERIMTGLSSQWMASTVVYADQGDNDAILRVTLNNGDTYSGLVSFTADSTYGTPTPTPGPTEIQPTVTPLPVVVEVTGIQPDVQANQLSFELVGENEFRISEYTIRYTNSDTGIEHNQEIISAPIDGQISTNIAGWPSGRYTIQVTAFDTNGIKLTTSESGIFTIAFPTATPTSTLTPTHTSTHTPTATKTATPTATQPTNTPVPVGATLNSVQFDEEANIFRLRLALRSRDRIADLTIQFFDSSTGQLIGNPFRQPANDVIEIDATGFPAAQYRVLITSLDNTGTELAATSIIFTHTLPTPTPLPTDTPTATPAPTSTPVVAVATIGNPQQDNENNEIIFTIQTTNEQLVNRYEVEFIDEDRMVRVHLTYTTPLENNEIRVPLEGLEGGQYTIILQALGADGLPVADQASASLGYNPPEPTPEPTSVPLISQEGLRKNINIIGPVVGIMIVGLIVLLFILARRPKQQTGTGFLEEMTGAQDALGEMPQYEPSAGPVDPDATNPIAQYDPDATNPIAQMMLPPATLRIDRSRDAGMTNQMVHITHIPFKIGRKSCDLTIGGDDNISRTHAEITFSDDTFYIADNDSLHGTVVDGQKLSAHSEVPIYDGAQIVIGTTTLLSFSIEAEEYDPDKTSA